MAFPFLLYCSPLYDWKAMEADGFTWWVKRIKRALDLYDEFRIDHFRGLAGFWAVPSGKLNTSGC
jgi:4-alpha-glucanotransferase